MSSVDVKASEHPIYVGRRPALSKILRCRCFVGQTESVNRKPDIDVTCFKNTKRGPWDCYIDVPGYGPIVEMTPRWLDELTLQVALSDHGRYYAFHTHTTLARLVGVRRAIPELADALRWCAERRMGTRVVCVPGSMNDQLAATLQDWKGPYGRHSAKALLAPDYPLASHQLKFKSWDRAFAFRLAWY